VPPSPEDAMEKLHQAIVKDIERVVTEAIERINAEKDKR
jgi:hypothetical protein